MGKLSISEVPRTWSLRSKATQSIYYGEKTEWFANKYWGGKYLDYEKCLFKVYDGF